MKLFRVQQPPYAWSTKGKKAYGNKNGVRPSCTNLIAAKRGKELLTPYLYEQTTTSEWFSQWLEHSLIKDLKKETTVIMDNAAFHKKDSIQKILKNMVIKHYFYHHTHLTLIPLSKLLQL